MAAFLLRRLAGLVLVMFSAVTITFLLIRVTPGGPFDRERKIPPQIERALLRKYKLDGTEGREAGERLAAGLGLGEEGARWLGGAGSLAQQYLEYLADLLRGDLRQSTKYRDRTVLELIGMGLPVTASLGALALALALGSGISAGIGAVLWKSSFARALFAFKSLLFISLPSFVTGPLMVLCFALWLGWLPVGGWEGPAHLIMPAVTLALPYAAYIARLTRAGLLDALGQDYIRTAVAKGLSRTQVVWGHALRPALLPVVSYAGPLAAHLLTGSVVVETVYNLPGAGLFFVSSILNRDGFLLGGVVIVYSALLVVMNTLSDVACALLDPRVRLSAM